MNFSCFDPFDDMIDDYNQEDDWEVWFHGVAIE